MSDNIADLYQSLIMERTKAPHHAGRLSAYDGDAEGDNPMCGDRTHLWIRRAGGKLAAIAHETRGCAITTAASDLMGDAVLGKTEAEIYALADAFESLISTGTAPATPDLADLRALGGVHEYRSRHRCATLPWQALRAALKDQSHG